MDSIDITLIVSGLTLLSNIVLHLRLKHCHLLCCSSDCYQSKSQPGTPKITSKSNLLSTN